MLINKKCINVRYHGQKHSPCSVISGDGAHCVKFFHLLLLTKPRIFILYHHCFDGKKFGKFIKMFPLILSYIQIMCNIK